MPSMGEGYISLQALGVSAAQRGARRGSAGSTAGVARSSQACSPGRLASLLKAAGPAWALGAVNAAVLAFVAWRLLQTSTVQLECLTQLKRSSRRLWQLATQGGEAAGAVGDDLGEADEHGVYTFASSTGQLYFRQTRQYSEDRPGSSRLGWEWSRDRSHWFATSCSDSLWFLPDSSPSCADRVLIRRLEVEAALLAGQDGGSGAAAAEQLPPLDLSQATRNLAQVADIPAAFICPLSCRLMSQPVVTPSGASFDRPALLDWIRQQHTDPVSGHPLRSDQVVPNLVLRDLLHAWAHSGDAKKDAAPL